MNTKREIHGLDQAVVILMLRLEVLLWGKVDGWKEYRNGFSLEVSPYPNSKGIDGDVSVHIYPIGFPKDHRIYCRFYKYNYWEFEEGQIPFDHPVEKLRGFAWHGCSIDSLEVENYLLKGYQTA